MPVQRPFNEHALWQGKIQLANYPSNTEKPPMILPKINTIVGGTIKDPTAPQIWEEINHSYRKYSRTYWARVKERQHAYRMEQANYPHFSLPSSFSPYQRAERQRQRHKPTPHASLEELVASPLDQFS